MTVLFVAAFSSGKLFRHLVPKTNGVYIWTSFLQTCFRDAQLSLRSDDCGTNRLGWGKGGEYFNLCNPLPWVCVRLSGCVDKEAFGATSSGSSSAWSKPRGQLELSGIKPKMAHCREDNARKRHYSQVEERNGSYFRAWASYTCSWLRRWPITYFERKVFSWYNTPSGITKMYSSQASLPEPARKGKLQDFVMSKASRPKLGREFVAGVRGECLPWPLCQCSLPLWHPSVLDRWGFALVTNPKSLWLAQ